MKVIVKNKRAFFDNEMLEKEIAGISLQGHEVKSIKNGNITLDGAYVIISQDKAILRNAIVPAWKHANTSSIAGYDKARDRTLLLTKKQIERLYIKRKEMKAQVIPLAVLEDHNLVKIEIALARSMKKFDKRLRKKERDEKLNTQRVAKTVEIRG